MKHARGRRDRRRVLVAGLTTAMTLAAVLAFTVPAGSAARAPAGRARTIRFNGVSGMRAGGSAVAPSPRTARARAVLARSLGVQGVIQSDPVTGTLRMIGRLNGYLTGPSRRPAARVAMTYVQRNLAAFGLSRTDLKTLHLRQDYVDVSGTHHVSWTQSFRGVTVFHNGIRANVTKDGRLVNVTGSPVHDLGVASMRPRISSDIAISAALRNGGARVTTPGPADSAMLVLFPTGHGARLAWRTLTWPSTQQLYLSVVDASTGAVLYRQSLTSDATTGTASAWEFYPSDLVPAGGNVANPVTFPVNDGTKLSGSNAYVYADVNDNNKPDAGENIPAVSGTDWTMAAALDTTNTAQNCSTARPCTWNKNVPFSWKANMAQNGAQVMYYLNKYHDHLAGAPYGFTAAAGNFEAAGGDPVVANSMDGANTNHGLPDKNHFDNANMSTLPDGTPPLMQMYLFRAASGLSGLPSVDGGDDAEVVYHEYTHGLSSRLVVYPDGTSGLTTQQANSMGEGWSDWYAEDFLNNQGLKPDTGTVGDVVMGAITFAGELRSQPVDCPVAQNSACPGSSQAGPGGYTYGDFGKVAGSPEVHADGEIWLETLWQIRQALGATTAETLVTRAMELSPPGPSFLDMRNAIIQADLVNFGGANQNTLWSIFAQRGMGYFAASYGAFAPVEDFSTPPDCSTTTCATISGTITDKATGAPAAGLKIGFPGLDSGFAFDLADTTDASGAFSISNVPLHNYPLFLATGGGYEPSGIVNFDVTGDVQITAKVVRDWASLEGGAKVGKFTPPDYGDFGCGPAQLLDLDVTTGWGSDAVGSTYGSHIKGPRSVIVKLPKTINVSSFGLASTGACGDGPRAGVKDFMIETSSNGHSWVTAFVGSAPNNGKLLTYVPKVGKKHVRYVRFTMLSNHGDRLFMDVMELTVHGK